MGVEAELYAAQSDSRFGSDFRFSRLGGKVRYRGHLVGPLNFTLRATAERLLSRSPLDVPTSEQLRWEGHTDVRGYGFDGLAPATSGDFKATTRGEIEFPLLTKWDISGSSTLRCWGSSTLRCQRTSSAGIQTLGGGRSSLGQPDWGHAS